MAARHTDLRNDLGIAPTRLFPTNSEVDRENDQRLAALAPRGRAAATVFRADDWFRFEVRAVCVHAPYATSGLFCPVASLSRFIDESSPHSCVRARSLVHC